jgi:hypothetical protein
MNATGLPAYVQAATVAVETWKVGAPSACPECRTAPPVGDPGHVVITGPGGVPAVLVGCGGYWTVAPALLDVPAGNWQPSPAWPFPVGAR